MQANIYKLWQLPKNKPSHQHRIIYNNTHKCVRHIRSIKNIRNSGIHWFLCNCRIIRTLYGLCQTHNARLLERRESVLKAKKSGGIIREAVLLERAALLERMQQSETSVLEITIQHRCKATVIKLSVQKEFITNFLFLLFMHGVALARNLSFVLAFLHKLLT